MDEIAEHSLSTIYTSNCHVLPVVAGAGFAGVPWSAAEDEASRDDAIGVTVSDRSSAETTFIVFHP